MSYERYQKALEGMALPAALVDLAAFDKNLDRLLPIARQEKKKVRLASKSLRHRALLERALIKGGALMTGLMTYNAMETAWLATQGFDDLLLAYPPSRPAEFDALAKAAKRGAHIYVMTDHLSQVEGLEEAARHAKTNLKLLIDIDMSLRPLSMEAVHLGVRRSPIRTQPQVLALARQIASKKHLTFAGIMGYEAQIAGLGDNNPFHPSMNAPKKLIRNLSKNDVAQRRGGIVEALTADGLNCEIVNGGGTGSIQSSSQDNSLTEVTIGSGLLAGHLFDYFSNVSFDPCLFFALPVMRFPGPGYATCFGGGYVASGAADVDKLPLPWLPKGLKLIDSEGAGEVQTPLQVPRGMSLQLGDPVFFRHAKSGELAERFETYWLLDQQGGLEPSPTYRGDGVCFG